MKENYLALDVVSLLVSSRVAAWTGCHSIGFKLNTELYAQWINYAYRFGSQYEYAFVLKTVSKHCRSSTIAISTQNNTCFELFWSDCSPQPPVFCCRNGWHVETMDSTFWCNPRSPNKRIWLLYFISAAANIQAHNFTLMTENCNLICSTADLRFPSLGHREKIYFQ